MVGISGVTRRNRSGVGDVVGLAAETTLRQTFVNAFPEPLEAVYIFPLPPRAAVTHFTTGPTAAGSAARSWGAHQLRGSRDWADAVASPRVRGPEARSAIVGAGRKGQPGLLPFATTCWH